MNNTKLYILGMLGLAFLGIGGMIGAEIFTPKGASDIIGHILTIVLPCEGVLIVLLRQDTIQFHVEETSEKLDNTHNLVNSKMQELLELTRKAAFAAGALAGEERSRRDYEEGIQERKEAADKKAETDKKEGGT